MAAIPKEIPELQEIPDAREHRVFFGAYDRDRKPIGLAERFLSMMPAAKEGLPAGDFRDWPEIEAWAAGIARELGAPADAADRLAEDWVGVASQSIHGAATRRPAA